MDGGRDTPPWNICISFGLNPLPFSVLAIREPMQIVNIYLFAIWFCLFGHCPSGDAGQGEGDAFELESLFDFGLQMCCSLSPSRPRRPRVGDLRAFWFLRLTEKFVGRQAADRRRGGQLANRLLF